MSKTEVSGKQVKDGSIELVDLSTALSNTISGKAEAADVTALDTRVTAVESDVAALQSASAPNLSDLGEVSITSPSADQILKYDGLGWVNAAAPSGGASNLDGLSDVEITSAAKGHFLVHNGTSFINARTIEADVAATVPLTIKGAASQSGNLFQIQNSSASNFITVDSLGMATFAGGGWNKHAALFSGEIGNIGAVNTTGVYAGQTGGYGILRIHGSNGGSLYFGGVGSGIYSAQIQSYGNGLLHYLGYNTVKIAMGDAHASYPGTLHVITAGAASKGVVVKGAASQSANLFEIQDSSSTVLFSVNSAGNANINGIAAGTLGVSTATVFAADTATALTGADNTFIGYQAGKGTTSGYANVVVGSQAYNNSSSGTSSTGFQNVCIGTYAGNAANSKTQAVLVGTDAQSQGGGSAPIAVGHASRAGSKAIAIGYTANAANNSLHIAWGGNAPSVWAGQITGNSSGHVAVTNDFTARRFVETAANAFSTSLAPSSGTLTVDSSAGNIVLGALSASVTTWAFTNVPTDNSRVTTVSAVIAGNTSYTYGSACSVNGNAVATGVQWFGGTAPTPSSTTDVLTFAIVRDSAGTIRVLGSAQTIDSVIGAASAGIDGAGSANYLSKWTDSNTIANSAIVESNGKLGIGETSPLEPIVIKTASGATAGISCRANAATAANEVWMGQGSDGLTGFIYARGNGSLVFGTNNSERMRIASDGTIGVAGGLSSIRRLGIHGLGVDNNTISLYCGQSGGSLTFCVYDGGDVRAPYVYSKTTASGANMFVGSDGTFYRSTSSLKYKTDVQNLSHGLDKVLELRPVTYKGNTDGNKVFGGLIAEEVHDSGLTEFVQYAEDGTPDALAYGNMVSLAFKAIQELNSKVDALQAEKEALEARIAALENN